MKHKGIACILMALLIIVGVLFVGIPGSNAFASDTDIISDEVLSIKCRVSKIDEETGTRSLRIVTTIDGENYKSLGFEITFLAQEGELEVTKTHRATKVFRKIDSVVEGVDYDFSPNVFSGESQWFGTCTIIGIPKAYWDNDIIIKPYVIKGGKQDYGQSRYIRMNDLEQGLVSVAVKGELSNPTVDGKEVVDAYFDGIYTHVKVQEKANYEGLQSITKYAVKDGDNTYTAKYRYLHSEVASDTSWYTDGDKVIVTAGDLRGFQMLARTQANAFASETIYLGADVDLNPDWNGTPTEGNPTVWTPIGRSAENTSTMNPFKGIFDGQGHTIKGVYLESSLDRIGLFAASGEGAVIQDFTLEKSYIKASATNKSVGSVVGRLGGKLEAVKSSADVVSGGEYAGGLVGDIDSTVGAEINNCWFAGSVSGTGGHHGQLLGGVRNVSGSDKKATCTISNSLATGSIDYRSNAGGLVGTIWKPNCTLTITDSLFAGTFVTGLVSSSSNNGTIIANATNGTAIVTNTYSNEGSGVSTKIGNKGSHNSDAGVTIVSNSKLFDSQAYGHMNLDFFVKDRNEDGVWFAMADSYPILTVFADKSNPLDLSTAQGTRKDWFDAENPQDSYTLYSPADFRGFQELSKEYNFYGIEIKLGNDIDLNPVWDAKNPTEGEPTAWVPIGRIDADNYKEFTGTFNGQGHTIRGLYMERSDSLVGMFAVTGKDAEIKDFTLENSYIHHTGSGSTFAVGSIAGRLGGTLNSVKSSADVVLSGCEYAGGLVGDVTVANSKIENCWFAGKVSGTGSHHGSLVGGVRSSSSASLTMENCLSTGQIDLRANAGGLVGSLWDKAKITITDTLNTGAFVSVGNGVDRNGTVIGNATNGTAAITNVYVKADSLVTETIGNAGSNSGQRGNVTTKLATELTGVSSYRKTKLEFYMVEENEDGNWVVSENSMPVLKSFADAEFIDLRNYVRPDTSWYAQEPYVISTVEELYGLAELSETETFANKTITLAKDIDININEGDASTWGEKAPKYEWVPIQNFAGTFDGGMNRIEGVYLKSNEAYMGLFQEVSGTVKNLVLENSCIISTIGSGDNGTGSIAGKLSGTLHTVKSSADVVLNGSGYAGGLAGAVITSGATIDNCWFAGSVSGAGSHHGTLLGGTRNPGSATIINCLSTGKIDIRANTGGLVGAAWENSKLTIEKTLYMGEFVSVGVSSWNIGTVVGTAKNNAVTATDVYVGIDPAISTILGSAGNNSIAKVSKLKRTTDLVGSAPYGIMNVDFYEKDRNEDGVWFAMPDSYPILTAFADTSNPVDLTTAQGTRTYWYDAENPKSSYTLNSAAELRGLQVLVEANNTFEGIEIKLGKDIDLNPEWKVSDGVAPNAWTPIGRSETTSNIVAFKGIFNGQGHTIKGVYVSNSSDRVGLFATTAQGSEVKNFTLENSVIYSTKTSSTGSVGSIVGRLGGTLNTVKSSADVILSGCEYAGGLVGDITTTGATITNCWFDGSVSGPGGHHAQLLGGVREGATGYVTHSLATGTIEYEDNTGGRGGLVGTLWGGSTLHISDSLFAGTFYNVTDKGTHGAVVGNANIEKGTVNVENVYVQKGSGILDSKIIGNTGSNNHNDSQKANVTYVEKEGLYLDDARENTALKIYPQGMDTSSDGGDKQYWWYVSETQPVLASFATPVTYDKLKVSTYNIGYGRKNNDVSSDVALEKVAEFIKDNNIDVCILQEVNGESQCNNILESLPDYYYHYQQADTHLTWGSIGIAIISKYEIVRTDYKIVTGGVEKRVVLKALVDTDGDKEGDAVVIGTHFDNQSDDSKNTAITEVETMVKATPEMPIVFAGDLNILYDPTSEMLNRIATFLTSTTAGRNANTIQNGTYQVDYVFVNSNFKHGYTAVKKQELTVGGTTVELSDHRPLVVNLYMNIK